MRTLLKHYIIDTIALYLVSQAVSGLVFSQGLYTLLLTGLALMVSGMVIKPVINLLLLPLNLITLGLFKWVAYTITFYLVTLIVPGFEISGFLFGGYSSYWFSLPSLSLYGIFAFIAFSLTISFVSSSLRWLFK